MHKNSPCTLSLGRAGKKVRMGLSVWIVDDDDDDNDVQSSLIDKVWDELNSLFVFICWQFMFYSYFMSCNLALEFIGRAVP